MCGILGVVAPVGGEPSVGMSELAALRDRMAARGPDGAGLFEHRNVRFAHRRLAIRDREGGAQPWLSDDGQTALVYNGELYNDASLRDELSSLGHRFRTTCDTETVMAAWRQWGPECVERFVGMFAVGLYDFRDDTLFLARDPCGVKPLFLKRHGDELTFASTVRCLLGHPRARPVPHWPAVSHYLTTLRLTLGRQTLYEGIEQLLPGERLIRRRGDERIERYWDYPADTLQIGYDDAVEQVGRTLRDAVASQLVSDVPVGMFLSGGVDSSTLACLFRERASQPMTARCGGGHTGETTRGGDFDHARRCAAHVGFEYDETRVGPDEYLATWTDLQRDYATPVSTPTDVIIHRLASAMKPTVGVVLGGEGADEALCGYGVQHWSPHDWERSRAMRNGSWRGGARGAELARRSLRLCYGRDDFASEIDHYFALNSLIPTHAKPLLLSSETWAAARRDEPMRAEYAARLRELPGDSPARRHQALLHRVNLESLLGRLDSATMLAGLEARVPYTDHRFVETAFRLPENLRIDIDPQEHAVDLAAAELDRRGSLRTKRVLRSLAEKLMPRQLAQRRKESFPTPVAAWLGGPWRGRVAHRLTNSPFGRQHFQREALRQLAEQPAAAGMWLWPILNVLEWGDTTLGAA